MKDLVNKSAKELNKLFLSKEISAKEIVNAFYKQIEIVEPKIQALNSLTKDLAYKQAEELDQKVSRSDKLGPIAGVPIIVKDVLCVKNYHATCSSKILENFIAPYESTATSNLWSAGAICLAKSNMDEFAMGSSTENSAFKKTKNPWNLNTVPGGSSGGSAASVAAMEAPVSLGTDTGGSVRQPASFCGVVGLKPTYGRVSRFGLIAFASSLDQVGPFARDVYDTALILQHMSGYDPKDSTSLNVDVPDYISKLNIGNLKGKKIGLIKELIGDGIESEVRKSVENSIKILKDLGAEIVEISLPNVKYSVPVYYILATAEASSNLARYDGVKYGHRAQGTKEVLPMYTKTRQEGFGAEVKRRIMLGTYALSSGYYEAYYKKAQQVRKLVTQDFLNSFEKVDLMITPTCPTTAFELGSKVEDPLSMYLSDIATIPASLAGLPAISVPCGFDSKNLPIGLQIIAPALSEELLLSAAYEFEKTCNLFNKTNMKVSAVVVG
ncbi:MAG: Asp-tRNA(Asn)/Glu-tRNA(Gln) amidotransferase subunit GatA [Candidatus Melainabacteria bacterium]|nr:Asp-tRNA(Asn)/Glu-tRNA(Gln) amidotransferase subunit GatA [Candidatus Melainabacteria bacterium]